MVVMKLRAIVTRIYLVLFAIIISAGVFADGYCALHGWDAFSRGNSNQGWLWVLAIILITGFINKHFVTRFKAGIHFLRWYKYEYLEHDIDND